jgi:hypothetical protein
MVVIKPGHFRFILFGTLLFSFASLADRAASPGKNPYLADSQYAVTHDMANFTSTAGPEGPSRQLAEEEIIWKPIGPFNGAMLMYSGEYPTGKRVIWTGGYDRISKLDADTLEVLATYGIGDNSFFTEEEVRRHISIMDKSTDDEMVKYVQKMWEEPAYSMPSWYRLLTRNNELFMGFRRPDGSVSIRAYGEEDNTNPASKIRLLREWKMPDEVGHVYGIYGLQMTHDGMLVVATQDGVVIALSPDFQNHYFLRIPGSVENAKHANDLFNSYIRNGFTVDDQGGIYVVTRDNLHRIQWTGSKLSLDEKDGAWTSPYPNEVETGSGTTPALMGWGDDEDHLVIITDGAKSNNAMVFWRDEIPQDWKGIPGYNRRVAGFTPVKFGISENEQVRVENSLVVKGYGAFIDNTRPVKTLPDQGNRQKQWLGESYYMHVPGHEALGGTKVEWDPVSRQLKTAWNSQLNFVSSICHISGATELLYCWGNRDREWTLEGVNWSDGTSAFHYRLGTSQKYNVFGGPIIVAPNGDIDCACNGGLGMVRVSPKQQNDK